MHRNITFEPGFPIANLVPGHKHPLYPANPRKGGHETSLPELKASIYADGILQPLRVFTDMHADKGKYWVHVGERRLLASLENLKDHPDALITAPVFIVEDITPQEAFQESLTEQVNRLPLHAIDQFEAFAELKNGGMDEASIASHYCISRQVVRQRIALGAIARKILQAWRGEVINEACAREFTRLSSHKEQEKLFERLRKSNSLSSHGVRNALVPDQGQGAKLVEFVGLDAYRARGGDINEDLFNGVHAVTDTALASAMAKEKLEAECLRLTSMEGWAWAKPADDMPAAWRMYDRSTPKAELTPAEKKRLGELDALINSGDEDWTPEVDAAEEEAERIKDAATFRAFTDRQKKKSGCILSIDLHGRLSIEPGVILPEADKESPQGQRKAEANAEGASKGGDKPAAKAEDKAPQISNAQASELAVTLTEAAALSLAGNFNLSMAVALAAFAAQGGGMPARLSHNGMASPALKLTGSDDFAKNLATFVKMKPQQREELFARVVAASLQFYAVTAERHAMTNKDVAALVNTIDPKVMEAQLHKRFDPAQFFERAPKAVGLAAIIDVFGKSDIADTAPKSDVSAFAVENVPPSKWLPLELRPAGYTGPTAKPVTKSAGKAKAKPSRKGGR